MYEWNSLSGATTDGPVLFPQRELYGRRIITTDAESVDSDSKVLAVLDDVFMTHFVNRMDIKYLWDYYRGKQPVLYRVKQIRPEICNRIVENRANEIVSFKVGYLCGEPIQYIGRNGSEQASEGISQLNEMMFMENKATQDKEVIEWQMICGTAYRMILPNREPTPDDAPFSLYTLDPRDTFIVYSNRIGHAPVLGVSYYTDVNGICTYSVYSDRHYWKIRGGKVLESKPHALGMIPIFEYPANHARLGAFEIVLPLLDAINNVESNRLDGMEQFVQAFIKFVNCDISASDFDQLREKGAIKVKSVDGSPADVQIVSNELNQDQTQTLVDSMYEGVLTICGMPNRNGKSSTSDTGRAVMLRDGWSSAEARAKDSEQMFRRSEQDALKLVLKICREMPSVPDSVKSLRLKDIALQFTRRNYENIQSKSQVLTTMLQSDKIHPRLAFTSCGLFTDPERAYAESMAYYEKVRAENGADGETVAS